MLKGRNIINPFYRRGNSGGGGSGSPLLAQGHTAEDPELSGDLWDICSPMYVSSSLKIHISLECLEF